MTQYHHPMGIVPPTVYLQILTLPMIDPSFKLHYHTISLQKCFSIYFDSAPYIYSWYTAVGSDDCYDTGAGCINLKRYTTGPLIGSLYPIGPLFPSSYYPCHPPLIIIITIIIIIVVVVVVVVVSVAHSLLTYP